MASILDFFLNQQKELERYKTKYGPLEPSEENESHENRVEELDDDK